MSRLLAPLRFAWWFLREFVEQVWRDLRVLWRVGHPEWWSVARLWSALGAFGLLVCVLHFGGLAYDVYTRIWWWDLLTHALGGVGVAAIFYFGSFRGTARSTDLLVLVPLLLLVGAGFEVYEYFFKSFWWSWTPSYYALDTVVDLVLDAGGAVVVVVGHACWTRLRHRDEMTAPADLPED